jgi:hypothetical protein
MAVQLFAVPDPAGRDNRAAHQVQRGGTDAVAPFQSPYHTYLGRLAPSTRTTAAYRLTTIAAMLWPGVPAEAAPWHELDAGALLGLRARLVERYRFDTAANYLATAKGTLKAAWLLGMVGTDVWRRAAEVEAPKGVALPAGHYVDDEDWSRLFACIAQDRTTRGVRDLAIFALLRARAAGGASCWRSTLTTGTTSARCCGSVPRRAAGSVRARARRGARADGGLPAAAGSGAGAAVRQDARLGAGPR